MPEPIRLADHPPHGDSSCNQLAPLSPDDMWVIVSDRAGDAQQATAVAKAVGVPYRIKLAIPSGGSVRYKSAPRRGAMRWLDQNLSSSFEPPLPRLMLTVGNWPTAIALSLQQKSAVEIPIVLVGRPRPGQFDRFRAIVVSSQYPIPDHPAVVRTTFPPRAHCNQTGEQPHAIAESIAHLRSPLTAVFVGGPTSPFKFDAQVARWLADQLAAMQRRDGGGLYVATSPRTPAIVTQELRDRLPPGAMLFDWSTGRRDLNPYQVLLARADRFVVTGDSASMMVETAAQGRPLAIVELPYEGHVRSVAAFARGWLGARSQQPGSAAGGMLMALHRLRISGFNRDLRRLHHALFARCLATRFGSEPFRQPKSTLPDEMPGVGSQLRRALGLSLGVMSTGRDITTETFSME